MENEEVMTPEEGAAEAVQKPRRGRRGPRTEEQKQAAAKTREEHRQMAENLRPEVYIQYQDIERSVESLVEEAKADFRKEKKPQLAALCQAGRTDRVLRHQRKVGRQDRLLTNRAPSP